MKEEAVAHENVATARERVTTGYGRGMSPWLGMNAASLKRLEAGRVRLGTYGHALETVHRLGYRRKDEGGRRGSSTGHNDPHESS